MARPPVTIIGMARAKASLKAKFAHHGAAVERGLIKTGHLVQRRAQQKTPVASSDLKGSARTRVHDKGLFTEVWVTFGTNYAIYVHEVDAHHEVGEVKFLEKALRETLPEMPGIIAREVRVG